MGKNMNLNNLTPEEAQKILEVIQKDFEVRQREKERLRYRILILSLYNDNAFSGMHGNRLCCY